jgi:ABC-type phosphate transport system permease subunit
VKRRFYVAGHALLFAVAVTIACVGIVEIVAGGSLAQGLIRLAIAFVVTASQLRGIYWDRREAARGAGKDLELPDVKATP